MADLYKKLGKDYDQYAENKRVYETAEDKNSPEAQLASSSNAWLRNQRGITGDTYSHQDMINNKPYQPNAYTDKTNSAFEKLGGYERYSDPWKQKTDNLYDGLSNFSYNPEQDASFQSYKDMYDREGKSAERGTISNLTAVSGGRNNSWASAAASQTRQAYAQKTSDMIPQLAQQAYNRLLQQYNITNQMSERDYGRWNDEFSRQSQLGQLYNNMSQQEMQNLKQQNYDNRYYRQDDLTYDSQLLQNKLEKQYLPQEYQTNQDIKNAELYDKNTRNQYLEEQIKQDLANGKISYEQAEIELDMMRNPQKYQSFKSSSGGGSGSKAKAPTKTQIKDMLEYSYGGEDGKINKGRLLQELSFGNYSDDEVTTYINAAGITKKDIDDWQTQYTETVKNYMFPQNNNIAVDPWNLPFGK